jgi:hypothetical protein
MEAFVYCWTDFGTNKLYVGVHKGTPEDGYICSSKMMLQEYKKRPYDFFREIIGRGTYKDCYALETAILKSSRADKDPGFYNMHLNGGEFYCKGHTEETKTKQSTAKMGKKHTEITKKKHSIRMIGNVRALGHQHTEAFKEKQRKRMTGTHHALGWKATKEWRLHRSFLMRGNTLAKGRVPTKEQRENYLKGITVTCPYCQKSGNRAAMARWHFSKCKHYLREE